MAMPSIGVGSAPTTPYIGAASALISSLSAGTLQPLSNLMTDVSKATKKKGGLKNLSSVFKTIKGASMTSFSIIGAIISLMEAIGVVEPIMDMITMMVEILGAALMNALLPAIMDLFDALTESGLLDLIADIGTALGTVLGPVFDALVLALEAMNPLFEALSDILGTEGMQDILMVLGKILGTLIIIGFIPLIYIIYALGNVIAAIVDIIIGVIRMFTGQETVGFAMLEAWQEGIGGLLLDTAVSLGESIGKLWELEDLTGGETPYVPPPPAVLGDVQAGKIGGATETTIIYVDQAVVDEEELAALLEYRKAMGR